MIGESRVSILLYRRRVEMMPKYYPYFKECLQYNAKKKETTTYLYLIKNFMFLKAEQILQYMYMYILCKMLANRLFFLHNSFYVAIIQE